MCIGVAFFIDSYDFATATWQLSSKPFNNVLIPVLVAPPLLLFTLFKLRELALAHQELLAISSIDSLTQCLNRRTFTAMVEGYLTKVSGQPDRKAALIVVDVDYFKSVNDRFGHEAGDEALRLVGSAIRRSVGPDDLVARFSGEEFSIFLPKADLEATQNQCESIRAAVASAQFRTNEVDVPLSASLGAVAFYGTPHFNAIYRAADLQMYKAKAAGRNRVIVARHSSDQTAT